MKQIPVSLKKKLEYQFKAKATDSEPHIHLISKQRSINTLFSEIIHKDVTPQRGDVTIRHLEGDKAPSAAYAICIDEGTAKIYRRMLPASFDYPWVYQWTLGSASDVAIEYDGEWKVSDNGDHCYLQTEAYPYIFFVRSGTLYAQKWNNSSTRIALAEGVSELSACKAWTNGVDPTRDQGLVIAYLKSGVVKYRALCNTENGKIWEIERTVSSLGNGNVSLQAFRTNDYRLGFVVQKSDTQILYCVSERTYSGTSVRVESVIAETAAKFHIYKVRPVNVKEEESVRAKASYPYFVWEPEDADEDLVITRAKRLNREDTFYSYGVLIYTNKPVYGEIGQTFLSGVKITGESREAVSSVTYDRSLQAFRVMFANDIKRTLAYTITLPKSRRLWYERAFKQKWPIPEMSVLTPSEANVINCTEREAVRIAASGIFQCYGVDFHYPVELETPVKAHAGGTFEWYGVGPSPV